MIKKHFLLILFLMAAIGLDQSSAQDADMQKKGLEIMTEVAHRNKGKTLERNLTITITDKSGKKRKRVMEGVKKYYSDHSKAVSRFVHPKNIKGTTLLVYDYNAIDKEDDQWIYLPAAKKTRRIPASRSSEYFMGTDFTFEDMKEDLQLEKFDYKLLRTEKKNGMNVFVVESIPKTQKIMDEIGYARLIDWIEEESDMANKTVYYDKKNELLKELVATIINVDGIYTYSQLIMENKKKKHNTVFVFDSITFNKKISDTRFNKNNLK